MSLGHHISTFQTKVRLISSNSTPVFYVMYRSWQMFSGLGPLGIRKDQIERIFSTCMFFCCSKESYGCETVLVPDVDYFGDPYRTGGNPKQQ